MPNPIKVFDTVEEAAEIIRDALAENPRRVFAIVADTGVKPLLQRQNRKTHLTAEAATADTWSNNIILLPRLEAITIIANRM